MWTRKQVADRLGRSVATVRRLEAQKKLHPRRDAQGIHWFEPSEVEKLATSGTSQTGGAHRLGSSVWHNWLPDELDHRAEDDDDLRDRERTLSQRDDDLRRRESDLREREDKMNREARERTEADAREAERHARLAVRNQAVALLKDVEASSPSVRRKMLSDPEFVEYLDMVLDSDFLEDD